MIIGTSVKLNFNPVSSTRGSTFKLRKDVADMIMCGNILFVTYWVVNIWNSLPDYVVEVDSMNSFKSRLDKQWSNQEVVFYL